MTKDEYFDWQERLENTKEYQEEYRKREDQLNLMPGGAQGAKPDMRDWLENNKHLLEESSVS